MPIYTIAAGGDVPSGVTRASANVNTTAATLLTATGKGFTVRNISTVTIYLGYGASPTVSATNYTIDIAPGAYFEDPYKFNGVVSAIAASGTTNAVLTSVFS